MKNLGNKITLQTPSRGFSIEMGSAVTVIVATRFGMFYPVQYSWREPDRSNSLESAPRLYNAMYNWCDRWRWPLQWRLEGNQLAHGGLDLFGLVHHSPHRCNNIGWSHGIHNQCSPEELAKLLLWLAIKSRGLYCRHYPCMYDLSVYPRAS